MIPEDKKRRHSRVPLLIYMGGNPATLGRITKAFN